MKEDTPAQVPGGERPDGGSSEGTGRAAEGVEAAAPAEIEVEKLTKSFGRRRALHDVSFRLQRGGFLTVLGPNGAGKSTLLRVLATLSTPSSGSVRVAGTDPRQDPTPIRRAVGFIAHSPLLYPELTARENLRFYGDLYGVPDAAARSDALLERVELDTRRNDRVRTFSRGMRQRLAIARALLHRPRVLLLDEPHAGLDPHAVDILDGLLAEVRTDHTFVMVTHSLERGLQWATQVIVLAAGEVAYAAPVVGEGGVAQPGAVAPDEMAAACRRAMGGGPEGAC
jgi:heme exporter protein A